MGESDVWEGSEVADGVGGAVGEGMPVNQAFSIDVVVKNGLAFAQERPGLALGGGAALFAAQIGPSILSFPFSLAGSIANESGTAEGTMAYLAANIVQIALTLAAVPLQQLFLAGIILAAGRHVTGEEASWSVLYNGVGPAIRGFLYVLLAGLVRGLLLGVVSIPLVIVGTAAVIGGGGADNPEVVLLATIASIGVLSIASIGLWFATIGLELGYYAAILDGAWPMEALSRAWAGTRGAGITLAVTFFALGLALCMGMSSVYCLFGLVLVPLIHAVMYGGLSISWMLHARPEAVSREWEFVKRNVPTV